jgi:hypothetical protein
MLSNNIAVRLTELTITQTEDRKVMIRFKIEHDLLGESFIDIPIVSLNLKPKLHGFIMSQLVYDGSGLVLVNQEDPHIWLVCSLERAESSAEEEVSEARFRGRYVLGEGCIVRGLFTDGEVSNVLAEKYNTEPSLAEDVQDKSEDQE